MIPGAGPAPRAGLVELSGGGPWPTILTRPIDETT